MTYDVERFKQTVKTYDAMFETLIDAMCKDARQLICVNIVLP